MQLPSVEHMIKLLEAYKAGQVIQSSLPADPKWYEDITFPWNWDWTVRRYRIKPVLKRIPLSMFPMDRPVWVRRKDKTVVQSLIYHQQPSGVRTDNDLDNDFYTWNELANDFEWFDNGEWKPCYMEVTE